jgi:cytochrome c oxidase subunit 2
MNEPAQASTLTAATDSSAAVIHELGLVLYVGGAVILAVVVALAVVGAVGKPRKTNPKYWILGAGFAFPVIALSALLIYSIAVQQALHTHAPDSPLRIHIQAKQWWWQFEYETAHGQRIALANELYLPAGRPVELVLTAHDVIHSFWVPALAGKVDMIPGHTNRLVLHTSEPGVYRGQCAEFCGLQHALMAFFVVVVPEESFATWLAAQSKPVRSDDPDAREAYALFEGGGCAACHAIRGTRAVGTLGPDLTHVGSRRSLAAGTLTNHVGTMAGWIAGPQEVKPGSAMPATQQFTGRELRTLSLWLTSLK